MEARVKGVVVEGGPRALNTAHGSVVVDGGARKFLKQHHHNIQQQSQSQIGTVNQLLSGGIAGAFSKTCTAPLARLTILFQVHTKRRNKLSVARLNSLVYVMYNMKLREKNMKKKSIKDDDDPLFLDGEMSSDDEWVANDDTEENEGEDPLERFERDALVDEDNMISTSIQEHRSERASTLMTRGPFQTCSKRQRMQDKGKKPMNYTLIDEADDF